MQLAIIPLDEQLEAEQTRNAAENCIIKYCTI